MRPTESVLLLAVVTLAIGCSGGTAGSAGCETCPAGKACGEDGKCRDVCVASEDCGTCEVCDAGVCRGDSECDQNDPCAQCNPDTEVCVADVCFLACGAAATCPNDFVCVEDGAADYCVQDSSSDIRLQAGSFVGVQRSSGGGFVLHGALQAQPSASGAGLRLGQALP